MKNILFFPLSIESVLDVPSSSSPGLPDFLSRWAASYEKGLEVSFSQLLGWLILLLRAISVALSKPFATFKTIKFKVNISKLPDSCQFYQFLSQEVQKSNFRQYGQMKQQRWSQRRERNKKEDAGARKGRKVAKRCVLQMIVFQEGRKVGSRKRQARSHLARWELKNCTPFWREADLEAKSLKAPHLRRKFCRWGCGKSAHRCGAKHMWTFSEHFWRFRCSESARRCGPKHMSK